MLSELVAVIVWRDTVHEKQQRKRTECRPSEIYHIKGEVLGYYAAAHYSDTYADVPCREIGACGSGALVVGCEIDVQ